jgi:DNA-binding MarR family transcriptional regulator
MSADTAYRLHASLGYHLSLAARIQERRLDEGLKTLGLTRITWCVLLAIGNESLRQPSDIARFVGIDRTAASRTLRQMESTGLIARGLGKGDGRTRTVALTEKGQRLLDQGTPMAIANNATMERNLDAPARRRLIELLQSTYAGEDISLAHL